MKVIYSLSHLKDWIGFAHEMKRRLGWEPVYWLTTAITEPMVQSDFPETIRHRYADIIQGKNPEGTDLFQSASLDAATLKEYAFEMDQALKMMDRLDSGDAFSYNERKRYFLKILNYSINVVRSFKPDVVVFTEVPHHATQYILYAVCRKQAVHTLMFKPVYLWDLRLLIYNAVEDNPFVTLKDHSLVQEPSPEKEIDAYLQKLSGDYRAAEPDYMKKQKKSASHGKTYVKTLTRLLAQERWSNLFSPEKSTNILKLKGKRIEESSPNRLQLYWLKAVGSLKKRRLSNLYKKLSITTPDLSKPFIFVPLQYQPERTSSPDGGAYVDQYLMINLLRSAFSTDIPIYIKEHTSQFHPKMDGHLGRFPFDYYDYVRLQNVHLIPTAFSSFQLIDASLCVATLTGTVGLEAVARNKPVLIFGPGCWYRSLPGVFYIDNDSSLQNAVEKIHGNKLQLDNADLKAILMKFHAISFRGKLTPAFPLSITPEQNVKNFADAVEQYAKVQFQGDAY